MPKKYIVTEAPSLQYLPSAEHIVLYTEDGESYFKTQSTLGVSSIEGSGDSWAAGFGTTATKYDYMERLGKLLGGVTVSNLGLAGATVTGTAAQGGAARILQSTPHSPSLSAGPYFSKGGLKIDQCAYNDQNTFGNKLAATNALVENCLTARYSALKAARQIKFDEAGVVAAGSGVGVAYDSTICIGTGYFFMSANGQYVDILLDANYGGEAVTFFFPIFSTFATNGKLTFKRDPTGANVQIGEFDGASFNATLKTIASRDATCCLRIAKGVLPVGAQLIRMTASGLTGSNYCAFTGAVIEGNAPLLIPGYRARDSSYDADIAWANARMQAALSQFPNAQYVDTASLLAESNRLYYDAVHPNNLGHARITKALMKALPSLLTSDNVSEMN